jgi:hypothetical protein
MESNIKKEDKVYYQSHISFAPAYSGAVGIVGFSYFFSQSALLPFALVLIMFLVCKSDRMFCFLLLNSATSLSAPLVFIAIITCLGPAIFDTLFHLPIVRFLVTLLIPVGSIITAVLLVKLYNEELLSKHGWEKSSW